MGNGAGQADYLLVINNDIENASMLSISPDGSFLQPSSFGEYAFSAPLVKGKDGVFSVSFVAVPAMDRGTGSEVSATNQWSSNNSAWFAGRFGFGWQDSFGEWLAANVLIPVVGVENLAGASDTVLIVGTVGVAIAVVAGGEVVLGVGTLGGGGAAAAAGGGGLTTAAAEAEATRRYINLIGNAVRTGKDLVRRDPTDFL
ncbi:MAG: hypothetical protein NTV29_00030 [Planctomycetota bacterium]|nr:hypothetical protein [Planctomycetota bacterium]